MNDPLDGFDGTLTSHVHVFHHFHDGVLVTEQSLASPSALRIIYVNPAFERLTKYAASEVCGLTTDILYGSKTGLDALDLINAAVRAGDPICCPLTVYLKDGTDCDIELEMLPLYAKEVRKRFVVVLRDMTDKNTEANTRQLEHDQFERFAAVTPGVLCTWRLSIDGVYSIPYISTRCEELFGLTSSQLKQDAMQLLKLVHPDDADKVRDVLTESARSLQPLRCEYRSVTPQYGTRWIEVYCTAIREPGGSTLWHGIANDISSRKLAEAELVESEARYRAIFEHSVIGIAHLSISGRFKAVNGEFCRIVRRNREELLDMNLHDVMHPEDTASNIGLIQDLRNGKHTDTVEQRLIGKDNFENWVRRRFYAVRDQAGNTIYLVMLVNDIHNQKVAELSLIERNRLLDLAHVMIRKPDGRILFWNTGMAQLYGWSAERAVGQISHHLFQTLFPVPKAVFESQLLENGVWEGELVHTRSDGSKIIVASHQMLQRNSTGEPTAVLEVNNDVTALRRAEAARRQTEAELAAIISSAMDAIITVDEQHLVVVFNEAAQQMFGCSKSEAIGAPLDRLIPVRYRNHHGQLLNEFDATNVTNRSMSSQTPIYGLKADGAEFPIEATISKTVVDNRTLFTVIIRDISERKLAEDALRQSKELSIAVLNSVPASIAVLDTDGAITAVNESWVQFGEVNKATENTLNPIGANYLEVCLGARGSADAETAMAAHDGIRAVLEGSLSDYSMEYPCNSEYEQRWFNMSVTPMRNTNGGVVVTHTNVTERKVASIQAQHRSDGVIGMLHSLKSVPGIEYFLGQMLSKIPEYLDGLSASLWTFNSELNSITLREHVPLAAESVNRSQSMYRELSFACIANSVWDRLTRGRQPLLLDSIEEFTGPIYRSWPTRKSIYGVLLVPLLLGDEVIGCLTLHGDSPMVQLPPDLDLVTALAQQVTLALQMTELAERGRQVAVLNERNRMAQDIHDTLAQGFTGILRQLEAATYAPGQEESKSHVAQASDLARMSLREARRSVHALRPQLLDKQHLPEALNVLISQNNSGIGTHVKLNLSGHMRNLDATVEESLFRIAQEALTNALKHAEATTVAVHLEFEPGQVELTIRDNGQGFEVENRSRSDGIGIIGMRERAEKVGGAFSITSHLGKGTVVRVVVSDYPVLHLDQMLS